MKRFLNSLKFQITTSLIVVLSLVILATIVGVSTSRGRIRFQENAALTLQLNVYYDQLALLRSEAATEQLAQIEDLYRAALAQLKDFETTDEQLLSLIAQLPESYQPGVNVFPTAEAIYGRLTELSQTTQSGSNITIIGIMTIIAACIPIVLTVRTARSATGLINVSESFGAGHYDVRASEKTLTEIADLARSFNTMADAVKKRENDLRNLNETLEQRVEDRTADLIKANEVAQESVRLKSEFLSSMSHELRTPLNAILGFTSIMLEGLGGEIDDEARHMLTRVDANSQRLLHLINELLDLAKIEAGRMEVIWKPFELRPMVSNWQSQIQVLAIQKGLSFKTEIDPHLPQMLLGDSERLTQIAVNLLSNAIKFTEQGGVTLSVQKRGLSWVMEVSDTGVGIPPHALNYIFEEFRQIDGSSKRMYGGTGLGLAIVRNLCQIMNGDIQVRSELGKGSTFTVTLPLITESPVEELLHMELG